MLNNIELDNLSKSTSAEDEAATGDADLRTLSAVSAWAWTSAVVLAMFAICLLAFPRFLLFLAEPSGGRATLTSLEKYLALQLGIILGTLAITIISVLPNECPTPPQRSTDPKSHPLLRPVTAASLVMALLSSDRNSVGTLTTAVLLGSSVVGLFGLWMLVFAGSPPISRKTGADKHTSSFIFGNKSAASVRKKLWKRGQSK